MKSKGFHRLVNRLDDFMCDYEFAQVINKSKELLKSDILVFVNVKENEHPTLFKHPTTTNARSIVTRHLQSTIAVSFIKEAYEEVTEYIKYILYMGAKSGKVKPERISDSVKVAINANRLLSTSTHDEVIQMVVREIYQELERERSTIELIKKTCSRLDLNIDKELINQAIKYLDIRHIFVHEDGKPNKDFRKKFPEIKLNNKGRINLAILNLHNVKETILKLFKAIDDEMVKKNLIIDTELQP